MTVKSDCYCAMISDDFFSEIVAGDLEDIWYQQNDAIGLETTV